MTPVRVGAGRSLKNVMGNNMRSTCPSCLSQVEHPHSDLQVVCSSCGDTFSPFLAQTDINPPPQSDFSESASAFKEIIDFGQSMQSTPAPVSPSIAPEPTARTESVAPLGNEAFIASTTDLSSDYRISQWLPVISRMVLLGDDPSPLQKGIHELTEVAQSTGANALIGIRCTLAPDNRRALLVGTPVRCERIR